MVAGIDLPRRPMFVESKDCAGQAGEDICPSLRAEKNQQPQRAIHRQASLRDDEHLCMVLLRAPSLISQAQHTEGCAEQGCTGDTRRVHSWDATTGKRYGHQYRIRVGGALATGGGVVFYGTLDGGSRR